MPEILRVFSRSLTLFLLCAALAIIPATTLAVSSPTYFSGANFDSERYEQLPGNGPLARGDYTDLPSTVSLKRFAPRPGNQGAQGSCVGWATAYAARTLAHIVAHNTADGSRPDEVFSPSYIYNQIFNPRFRPSRQESCVNSGALVFAALDLMRDHGVVPLVDYPYSDQTCFQPITAFHKEIETAFRIETYKRLFNRGTRSKHVAVRRSIAAGNPVVIGMLTPDGFQNARGVWAPNSADFAQIDAGEAGGHAMTVVGYDDGYAGGAFEIINSWGTGWGNGGFIWIAYDTFNALMLEGYEVVPPRVPVPGVVDMQVSLNFVHIGGLDMPAEPWGDGNSIYRMTNAWPSGTRFRVEVTAAESGYIYVLGGDLSGRYVELFPRDSRLNPHLSAGSTLLIPGPTEDYYTRMDETEGIDFYIALVAREPLDIDSVLAGINRAPGDISNRLEAVLGEDMIDPQDVERHGTGIGIAAMSRGRLVAPIVVAIDHVAPREDANMNNPPLIVVHSPAVDVLDATLDAQAVRQVHGRSFRLQGIAQADNEIDRLFVAGAVSSRFSSRGPFEAEITLPSGPGPHSVEITAVDMFGNRAIQQFSFEVIQ